MLKITFLLNLFQELYKNLVKIIRNHIIFICLKETLIFGFFFLKKNSKLLKSTSLTAILSHIPNLGQKVPELEKLKIVLAGAKKHAVNINVTEQSNTLYVDFQIFTTIRDGSLIHKNPLPICTHLNESEGATGLTSVIYRIEVPLEKKQFVLLEINNLRKNEIAKHCQEIPEKYLHTFREKDALLVNLTTMKLSQNQTQLLLETVNLFLYNHIEINKKDLAIYYSIFFNSDFESLTKIQIYKESVLPKLISQDQIIMLNHLLTYVNNVKNDLALEIKPINEFSIKNELILRKVTQCEQLINELNNHKIQLASSNNWPGNLLLKKCSAFQEKNGNKRHSNDLF